jgi:hypothetical protein
MEDMRSRTALPFVPFIGSLPQTPGISLKPMEPVHRPLKGQWSTTMMHPMRQHVGWWNHEAKKVIPTMMTP